MHWTRYHWRTAAAGLLLAVAAGPAVAEDVLAAPPPKELPDAAPALPAPRQGPAPAPSPPAGVLSLDGAGPAPGSAWQRWRDEKHAKCQANFWGYPEQFEAPPLGAAVYAHNNIMVANGQAAAMVLFLCDFEPGNQALNPHGMDRLARMAAHLASTPFPIIVERPLGLPGLGEARRAAVLGLLAREGIAVPPERVVIGPRISVGLQGPDAFRVYLYHVSNMAAQGGAIAVPTRGAGTSPVIGGGTGTGAFGAPGGAGGAGGGAPGGGP